MNALLMAVLVAQPLTLDEVRAASTHNLQALQASLDVSRAKAQSVSARAPILPQVDLTVGVSEQFNGPRVVFNPFTQMPQEQNQSFFLSNFNLQLQVQQLLYDGGRWWSAIAQAGAQEQAAEGQLKEQQLASQLEAVRRFFEFVRSQVSQQVLLTTLERSRAQLARAQSLFEAGRVQRRDVLDAEVNVGNDEIALLRQGQAVVSARADAFRWLGMPVRLVDAEVPSAIASGRRVTIPSVDELQSTATATRPLVKVLNERAKAAELAVTIANADNLPRVGASLSYGRSSPVIVPFFDPRFQHALQGGITMNWNLFRGLETQAQSEKAKVEVSAQTAAQAQALVDLSAELQQARASLEAQQRIGELASKNVMLAEQSLALEEGRYAAGAGSQLEVRTAQLKLTSAQLQQVTGRVDAEISVAALERALGQRLEAGR